ncbi:hypothetical protein P7C70_g6785, partial [Phenoliferia sp. Uapishka_3]
MTFQFLLHSLTQLHDAFLLTSFCSKGNLWSPSLLTIICAGLNSPLDDIRSLVPRYVFGEAEIRDLFDQEKQVGKEVTPVVGGELDVMTGWDGMKSATEEQKETIRKQVDKAHEMGLVIRYSYQNRGNARELVRKTLMEMGVDLVM